MKNNDMAFSKVIEVFYVFQNDVRDRIKNYASVLSEFESMNEYTTHSGDTFY